MTQWWPEKGFNSARARALSAVAAAKERDAAWARPVRQDRQRPKAKDKK